MKNIIENEVGAILTDILDDYKKGRAVDKMDIYNQPDKTEIMDILDSLFSIVYPGFFRDKTHKIYNIEHSVSTMIEDVMFHLNKQICVVLKYTKEFCDNEEEKLEQFAQKATVSFMRRIPKVREYLETDLQAAYDGDPAARSKDEIVFSYPGLYAITVYRLAHELFLLGVPLIPRMMTEQAHSKTGIDIHPGATIGKYFFIDHRRATKYIYKTAGKHRKPGMQIRKYRYCRRKQYMKCRNWCSSFPKNTGWWCICIIRRI